MLELLGNIFLSPAWWGDVVRIAAIALLAWVLHRRGRRIARRMARLSRFTPQDRRPRPQRLATLQDLFTSAITILAFTLAVLFSLAQFVDADTLVWIVGLFSAAFGLGARPLISDFLSGVSFIFEDTFDVGEKVEINTIDGTVEAVNLRTTLLRSPTGELYVIPNGEVRVIRNFSRGRFSTANISLKVAAADLSQTLEILEALGKEAVTLLPNLLEPWTIISESGVIGLQTELTLLARARFGRAADLRPRLLALVQERLTEAGIQLVD